MAKNPKILSIVLAGGEGTRLMPLTRDRAKPAVPFGGVFRLIDFPLSNLVGLHHRKPLTHSIIAYFLQHARSLHRES